MYRLLGNTKLLRVFLLRLTFIKQGPHQAPVCFWQSENRMVQGLILQRFKNNVFWNILRVYKLSK